MYDLDRMREDIDLREILPRILSPGDIRYLGSTMYCRCVSGLHRETRIDHNAVSKKFCHCFSCGESYDAFTYVKKYHEYQGYSLSFSEVCEIIGDALGGSDRYVTDKKKIKSRLPLSQEEMRIIGISSSFGKNTPSLKLLYEQDPGKTKKMLMERAYESMRKYKVLSEQLGVVSLRNRYMELYQRCREIYDGLGGPKRAV